MNRECRRNCGTLVSTCVALALAPVAQGAEFEIGDGRLRVNGSAYIGTTYRTAERDDTLVPSINARAAGTTGNSVNYQAGRNQDDANLNYDKGDPVSQVIKGYITVDYRWQNYGVLASAKGWYDYAQARRDVPWGSAANGYAAGEPLSDEGAPRRGKFGGLALDNLYAYGSNPIDGATIDWILGNQKLDWGNRYLVFGGLQDINPLDIPAVVRPGVVRFDETRIAFPAAFSRLVLPNKTTKVEAFYQFHFEPNVVNQCGTYYSQLDYLAEGCNAVFLSQPQSDRQLFRSNDYVKRMPTQYPSNGGQGGVALKHLVEDWGTELGMYAVQIHSRASFYSGLKLANPVPTPSVNAAMYFTEYPEDIRMFALSFDTKFTGGAFFGELSYRPNQPLQYNATDLVAAFTSSVAPSPLRAEANAVAPGQEFHGWQRHKAVQLQFGAGSGIPDVLGASALTFGGELVYKLIPDLPDPSVTRFGRADIFGQGPVNGVCMTAATNDPGVTCTQDGYVSRFSWGYRLRAALPFTNVLPGIATLTPSIFFGQDVQGWSYDFSIIEGRKLAAVALNADFTGGWTAGFNWVPTWGGTYNNLRDRSVAQAWLGYKF